MQDNCYMKKFRTRHNITIIDSRLRTGRPPMTHSGKLDQTLH